MTIDTMTQERLSLPDRTLSQLHKCELQACLADNPGKSVYDKDHPLHALHERHRQEWVAWTESAQTRESAELRAAARDAKAEAATAQAEVETLKAKLPPPPPEPKKHTCVDCGCEIVRKPGRGRPPKWCADCRSKNEAAKEARTAEGCGACRNKGRGRHLSTCPKNPSQRSTK